jgi:hypothetical protein
VSKSSTATPTTTPTTEPSSAAPGPTDRRASAYRAGAAMARERIAREAPSDFAALEAIEAADIVVVRGQYDHVESVLAALELEHTVVEPVALEALTLAPHQLLVVNCPGNVPPGAIGRIRRFVEAGGSLFTTDWALRHVIEPAFPGVLAYNERPTADDVVRIEARVTDNQFLRGVLDDGDDPQWWLEASSYPIRILDPERVQVLITSAELGSKYGEAPVAVLFEHGRGEVFHMISHYYLQRTDLRTARHQAPAASYFAEKAMPVPAGLSLDFDDLAAGEVESAQSSSRLFANIVAAKKRRSRRATRVDAEEGRS